LANRSTNYEVSLYLIIAIILLLVFCPIISTSSLFSGTLNHSLKEDQVSHPYKGTVKTIALCVLIWRWIFPNPKLSLLLPPLPYGFTKSKRQFLAYTTLICHTEYLLLSEPEAHKHHHRHLSLEPILS